MLNPNLKTVFHKIISLTRFKGGHAESAIIHSGLQNTQQAGGKLPFTADPILSIKVCVKSCDPDCKILYILS